MYVSALDRPWVETPFLFQGFLIESPEVIEALGRYCRFVYIDVERSDHTVTSFSGPRHVRTDARTNGHNGGGRPGTGSAELVPDSAREDAHDDSVLIKAELQHARTAHEAAGKAIHDLLGKIGNGENVDIGAVEDALNPMIDSIVRNDDAMSWLARMKKKGEYIYDHSIASSIWAMIFGKHLGLDKNELQKRHRGSGSARCRDGCGTSRAL